MITVWDVAAIIALLAVVQSVFGMGILVFGTPTLLLLGAGFPETLATLLPSSLAISAIQTFEGRRQGGRADPALLLWCVPAIMTGLALALSGWVTLRIEILIGAMLIGTAAVRSSARLRQAIGRAIRAQRRLYLAAMGLVHGLTNMGGALLAVYAAGLHDDKQAIRHTVAVHYLVFGLTQLSVLFAVHPAVVTPERLLLLPIPVLVYAVVGNRLYRGATEGFYQTAVTLFTGAYGCAILAKQWL